MRKHIFVALGHHHVINSEKLIENGVIDSGEKILLAGDGIRFQKELWDKVIVADRSFDNKSDSISSQIKSIRSKIQSYKKILNELGPLKDSPVTVYVSYIEDVLSNYLFFLPGPEVKAVVIEDGTLNYYDHSLKNISTLKFRVKQLISYLHGIPFKSYKGHSSGAEYEKVIAQYLSLPDYAFIKRNVRQLPVEREVVDAFSNSLYIIGQESYGNLLGQSFFEGELDKFLDHIRKLDFYQELKTIYYKPHRNGKAFPDSYYESKFHDKEVVVLHDEKTSEFLYFNNLKSKYLASFDSSSLVTIFSRLDKEQRNEVKFFVNPLKEDELVDLFKNLGFSFIEK